MIKILKLYSNPLTFDPIEFEDGINLIVGERVEGATSSERRKRKTNGVGKSLSIEFINFCLFKRAADSRVLRIPNDEFSDENEICLDILVGNRPLTLIRTKGNPEKPKIVKDGKVNNFENIEDALLYLDDFYNELARNPYDSNHLSFREMIAPLIRDEDSEFKDILRCYDTAKRIPPAGLTKAHLYFFGIEYALIDKIRETLNKLEIVRIGMNDLKKKVTNNNSKKINDVKFEVSSLGSEVEKIRISIETLKTNEAYEFIQNDISSIEHELDKLRIQQAAYKYEIKKIRSLPIPERIDVKDVEIVYNQFKDGLGGIIAKSIDQVLEFKEKIEVFQSKVLREKLNSLEEVLDVLRNTIRSLEDQRSNKLSSIDAKGQLKDFRNSVSILNHKDDELFKARAQLDQYDSADKEKSLLELKRTKLFFELDESISTAKSIIESFNTTIKTMHEFIMGNGSAFFEIHTVNPKTSNRIIDLNMRIEDDGSHSVDRTKVFIYDTSLFFNEFTSIKHPGFLVHDNIFDVDQDTLVQSLNYLAQKEDSYKFQYILTLNRDKIEHEENALEFSIQDRTRAVFTKENSFLKKKYQEI